MEYVKSIVRISSGPKIVNGRISGKRFRRRPWKDIKFPLRDSRGILRNEYCNNFSNPVNLRWFGLAFSSQIINARIIEVIKTVFNMIIYPDIFFFWSCFFINCFFVPDTVKSKSTEIQQVDRRKKDQGNLGNIWAKREHKLSNRAQIIILFHSRNEKCFLCVKLLTIMYFWKGTIIYIIIQTFYEIILRHNNIVPFFGKLIEVTTQFVPWKYRHNAY